jgi:hypothetical protein
MDNNYSVYRCPDPIKTKTTTPWYPVENICPCDPNDTNISGRGFTPCAFGVQYETPNIVKSNRNKQSESAKQPGVLVQDNQNVPPQLQPRMLTRIGQQWRSAN